MRFALPTLLALSGLGLAGCGEQMLSTVPATTAAECTAQYDAAKQRGSNSYSPPPSSTAEVFALAIGSGLIKGALESAYDICLQRVGGTRPGMTASDSPFASGAAAPVAIGATCDSGAPVMQGGAGYCVAR